MVYYTINVKLTQHQKELFVQAITSQTAVSVRFTSKQLGVEGGDQILFTKTQINKLQTAKQTNKPVVIKFSKTQVMHLHKQIGNGILDSISNFFKGAASKVGDFASRAFRTARNYVSPPPIMLPDQPDIRHDAPVKQHYKEVKQYKPHAVSNQSTVRLRLTHESLSKDHNAQIHLTPTQHKAIERAKGKNKGLMITLSKKQLMYHQKGGFLPLLLGALVSSLAPVLFNRLFPDNSQQGQGLQVEKYQQDDNMNAAGAWDPVSMAIMRNAAGRANKKRISQGLAPVSTDMFKVISFLI